MASVVAVGSITIVDVMDGKTGGALMVSPSRALAFTATDGVLDVGQQNITFTAKVQGIEASSYLWEFTGFETYPTNSGTFAQTVTAAQFGNSKAATVTCTIDGTYSESFTISRLEKSSAEAGATKGADWSSNISGIPYDKIYATDAATNLGFNPSFESWTGQFPAGWGNWSVSGGTISKDTTVVRFGSNSVKMVASGASQLGFQRRVGFGSPMPAGTFVSGSVDMYLESIVSALPMMLVRLFVNAELTTYKDTFVLPSPTTGSWQKIPFSARVASNQQIHGIQIYMMGAYGGWPASGGLFNGTVYFDGLSFSFNEASTDASLKLNKAGDTITGRINMAVADGIFAGTDLNNGVYMGNGGIVGKKDGDTTFAVDTAGNASFAGTLDAATGTFAGSLSAATGSFAGNLTAGAINAVNTINIAGNAVTIPVAAQWSGSLQAKHNSDTFLVGTPATNFGGGSVVISCLVSGDSYVGSGDNTWDPVAPQISLYRNGVRLNIKYGWTGSPGSGFSLSSGGAVLFYLDAPGSASTTYAVHIRGNYTSYFTATSATISVLGVKR